MGIDRLRTDYLCHYLKNRPFSTTEAAGEAQADLNSTSQKVQAKSDQDMGENSMPARSITNVG